MRIERFKRALLSTLIIASLMVPLLLISAKASWGQEIEWIRQFGSSGIDFANGVAVDASDNVYVAGYTDGVLPGQSSSGYSDVFVRKYDGSGSELWTRQFGSSSWDWGESVAADPSGNVYVAGYTDGTLPGQASAGSRDAFVRKYDASGNEVWTRQFGSSTSDWAYGVAVDTSGNVYVAGWGWTGGDAFVRKYDSSGNEVWTRQFGPASAYSVAVDASDNVYVAGVTDGALPGQSWSGSIDAFVRKYDSSGNELWTRQFGSSAGDLAHGVAVDASGNVYVAGDTDGALPGQSSAGWNDAFVRKYDGSGNGLWTRQFGTSGRDYAEGVAVDASDNVYVAGNASGDVFLVKFVTPPPEWRLIETWSGTVKTPVKPRVLIPRYPIYIDGNAGFAPANGVNGGGSGTAGDPYIIENWAISAKNAVGIRIRNTTAYFVVRNCVVENGGWNGGGFPGIYLENVVHGKISNDIFSNNNHGIWFWKSDNNIISNNIMENNSRGIYLQLSDNNLIDNNLVENNSYGIDFWGSSNNLIDNNLVENNYRGVFLDMNNTLRGNVMRNNVYGFYIAGSELDHYRQMDIDNSNTIDGKPIYYLIGESNLVFDGSFEGGFLGLVESENIQVENLQTFGILFAATSNSTIANSTLTRAGIGIQLFQSYNDLIDNNLVENNFQGIYIGWSDNILVSNNLVENNSYGIYLHWYSDNNLVSNNFIGNNGLGISLLWSDSNLVSNNLVERNSTGIYIDISDNNLVTNNLVENSSYLGIFVRSSYNNSIYHNNFVNNATQARDDSYPPTNWDNGYPSGGNYWNDYAGVDENRGENQDIPGSDGIGDTPYQIFIYGLDRYPLMSLWLYTPPGENVQVTPMTGVMVTFENVENGGITTATTSTIGPSPPPRYRIIGPGVQIYYNITTTATYSENIYLSISYDENEVAGGEKNENKLRLWQRIDDNWVDITTLVDNENNIIYGRTSTLSIFIIAEPIWAGTADFSLVNLYTVSAEKILDFYLGSKLVVKFYNYADAFENENVIENFSPPWHIEENENARHPEGIGVKKAKLVLTDGAGAEIDNIATFTVTRDILWIRITAIYVKEWPFASPSQRDQLWNEITAIYTTVWPYAPL